MRRGLCALLVAFWIFAFSGSLRAETREERFAADLAALTRGPHRLAGTPEGRAAGEWIAQRLRALDVQVFELDLPIWQQRTEQCFIEVGGARTPAHALRPNVVVPPSVPGNGLRARTLYAGNGELGDYGTRDVDGAIVVLDYDSGTGWERAFALGAAAVVFRGRGPETPEAQKHAGVPSNQVRLYVDVASEAVDLGRDHDAALLHCHVSWQESTAKNLVAYVPGTAPVVSPDQARPEMLVVSANYDSFGVVPELSPGARGAVNVAFLLGLVERVAAAPAKRNVTFAFLDNGARGHQGARELYSALLLQQDQATGALEQERRELEHQRAMLALLDAEGLAFDPSGTRAAAGVSVPAWLANELEQQADHARDDQKKQVRVLRLGLHQDPARALEVKEFEAAALRWDEVRRALHAGELASFYGEKQSEPAFDRLFRHLVERTRGRFQRRVAELERAVHRSEQRQTLREGLGFDGSAPASHIALHVSLDLSDTGARFGVVVGDSSQRLFAFRQPVTEGDSPGYYGRVLGAFRDVSGDAKLLDVQTLGDPALGLTFAPGPFVQAGSVAGAYGIYNVALMTGYDRRVRDGHPADTVESLALEPLLRFGNEAGTLLQRLASAPSLSLPRVFKDQSKNKLPGWNDGLSTGDYVGLTVSGSLAENRPAAGALLAIWPGEDTWLRQHWQSLDEAGQIPAFDPLVYEVVDENGRFRVQSFREDMHAELSTLGALFDGTGQLVAINTTEDQAQKLADAMRVNLFFGPGGKWSSVQSYDGPPGTLKLLKASSDSLFRDNRALWGQLGNHGFFYVSDQIVDYRVKLFEPMGEAVLGEFSATQPFGAGVLPSFFQGPSAVGRQSAEELWRLNETRLDQLRARGVTSADLEILHGRAKRAAERAESETRKDKEEAAVLRSAALSQRVYLPLRQNMDDLVHAIVVLLLLSIPFAFALERLIVCASSVYGRIAGFAAMFLVTFALLYWMHPGFAIASTPMIVFLAFAIVLLSSLVIYLVVRKFKNELRAVQGQAGAAQLDISRTGTLLAAVGMGMSTMRRRPTRTVLTAVTVVMLTFTILSFASFSQTVGVKSIYEGPKSEETRADLLVRKLDYSDMPEGVLSMLLESAGEGGLLAPQYWLVREALNAPRLTVARLDTGKALTIDAVMGIDPRELERWPELGAGLGQGTDAEKRSALEQGGAYLPAIVSDVLGVSEGEEVLLDGRRVRFAGTLDGPALQRVRHLDNQSILPVDFRDAASLTAADTTNTRSDASQLTLAEEVDREFVHLSSDQVAVASADRVRRMGGELHLISVHVGPEVDVVERGKRLAELVVMPVWASGADGVERLLLTVLTGVSGGFALFVPLLLGGLIIFGTLLGSISDREKEIYTFSALGLSPGHVGVLFFAEAGVYAVVGGMGGQLLAQTVGLVASKLAEAGLLQPVSINYSSTNSLFAIGVVMATVLVSAVYPALRASKSANPGLSRGWKLPAPNGDELDLTFPFTVSAYDITGVVSFLAEHFRRHDDAGLGDFAASAVEIGTSPRGNLELRSELALAPFDLGVTQSFTLRARPSEIPGVDEVEIAIRRQSGAQSDWLRANRTFLHNLRRQFLIWRTLSSEAIEAYRLRTLEALGDHFAPETEPGGVVPTLRQGEAIDSAVLSGPQTERDEPGDGKPDDDTGAKGKGP